MKKLLLLLLSAILVFAIQPEARAGFWVKQHSSALAPAVAGAAAGTQAATSGQHSYQVFGGSKRLVHPSFAGMVYRGWVGILALLCGIGGFFYPGLAFAAVLFGIMGTGRRHKNSGIAIAGLVLGLFVVVLTFFASFEGFPLY